MSQMSLEDAMDFVQVHPPGTWESTVLGNGEEFLFAVSTATDNIVGYFYDEALANRFRLDLVNRLLNG